MHIQTTFANCFCLVVFPTHQSLSKLITSQLSIATDGERKSTWNFKLLLQEEEILIYMNDMCKMLKTVCYKLISLQVIGCFSVKGLVTLNGPLNYLLEWWHVAGVDPTSKLMFRYVNSHLSLP